MRDNRNKVKVALFNPIVAHYRVGLLNEFRASDRCEYTLFADTQDPRDGIPSIDLSNDSLFYRSRCTRLLRFTWQHGTLRAAFQDYDAYILIGNAEWITSWLGAVIARIRGKRVLFWTHGWTRYDGYAKRIVRNTLYRLAHGILLYGDRARKIGTKHGFLPETLYVIYNSLDFENQRVIAMGIFESDTLNLRTRLFGDAYTPVVVGSARLTKSKRFDLLIRALALLAQRGHRVNLLLVGDGPERNELEKLAVEQGIRAAFVGACYDEETLAQFFCCANATVSPGNVGLTCMHSLGYGIPVITHNDPDNQGPEWEAIEPGVTGALFERSNVASLATAIDEWTKTSWVDSKVRDRCVESIRSRYHPARQHQIIEMAVLGAAATESNSQKTRSVSVT